MKIAWIGVGVMGKSMALNLKKAGHSVSVYNRTLSKCEGLEDEGIRVCETIKDCVEGADAIFTIVGYPKDVEEVYLSEEGIFANAKEGAYMVDMTTSSPALAKKLSELGTKFHVLDAPVSGGDIGAKNGTLSIMVGGEKADFDFLLPVFESMGKNIIYLGKAGSGQNCKACNQIAIAGTIAATAEAVHYAESVGLDGKTVLEAISIGAAGSWQMDNNAPKMLVHDYEPGFFIKHFIKDLKIARDTMESKNEELPVLNKVLELYEKIADDGLEDEGTQAIIEYYK